jgi:hypothetical protein
MRLGPAENQPTERKVLAGTKGIGDHFEYLYLGIFPFAFIKTIQDDDQWLARAPTLESREGLNNEPSKLHGRGISEQQRVSGELSGYESFVFGNSVSKLMHKSWDNSFDLVPSSNPGKEI